MNLHGIVSPIIAAVNPMMTVTIQRSTGYTTAADGTQTPTYTNFTGPAQIQPISYNDIQHLDGLNIQGVRSKIYIRGDLKAIVRSLQVGGDLVIMPDGSKWLVAIIFEDWPDWTAAAITLQTG